MRTFTVTIWPHESHRQLDTESLVIPAALIFRVVAIPLLDVVAEDHSPSGSRYLSASVT